MAESNEKALSDFFGGVASARDRKRTEEQARLEKEAAEQAARDARAEAARAKLKTVFPDYFDAVEPIVKALEKLPPRDDREFFVRTDLDANGWDCDTNVHGPEIGMWILYSRRTTEEDSKENLPPVHSLAMNEKGTTLEDGKRIGLHINELPVFRVRSKPQADGSMKITAEHYTLDYVCTGRSTGGSGIYRTGKDGNKYREQEIVSEKREIAGIRGFAGAIGSWVAETAPERLDDVRKVLSGVDPATLAEKISLSKPLSFRKKEQGGP